MSSARHPDPTLVYLLALLAAVRAGHRLLCCNSCHSWRNTATTADQPLQFENDKKVLSPALVAFLLFGCGGNAESDSCQEGRQFYQKLKKAAQTGDRDGDGTVDIVEQEMLPALSKELKDFQTGWYEVGGCALDG